MIRKTEMNDIVVKILESWDENCWSMHSMDEIHEWVEDKNKNTYVDIKECSLNDSSFWFYDDYNGEVLNRKRSFFSIKGMRLFVDDELQQEQPIIVQPEIGYLGIICKVIDGVLHFLMQAKIEPGNVNCVQISPTIQATKSNFTRVHGGKLPAYFSLFENADANQVIYDQIQSEQATRFYKKRNRNIIICIRDEVEVLPNFMWMTLWQIKRLMKIDNLVNMDTRTVLAGLPLYSVEANRLEITHYEDCFHDLPLYNSIFRTDGRDYYPAIFSKLNNYKMFKDISICQVPLYHLSEWEINDAGITCKRDSDFMVRYYDIEISGREVQEWIQPLFKAIGSAIFGLLTTVVDDVRFFLVALRPEIGNFDKIEIGPTVQWSSMHTENNDNDVDKFFRQLLKKKEGIIVDTILSEEGGRFYHEQNRNLILEIQDMDLGLELEEYVWVPYSTLGHLVQVNNVLNIQLRNLLSLLNL